jgi:hypothetical protein
MPTYWARLEREQEAARQAEQEAAHQAAEEEFNEVRHIVSEERRCAIGRQLEADKLKRENQQHLQKEERG